MVFIAMISFTLLASIGAIFISLPRVESDLTE
jgi:hypothetical protein